MNYLSEIPVAIVQRVGVGQKIPLQSSENGGGVEYYVEEWGCRRTHSQSIFESSYYTLFGSIYFFFRRAFSEIQLKLLLCLLIHNLLNFFFMLTSFSQENITINFFLIMLYYFYLFSKYYMNKNYK